MQRRSCIRQAARDAKAAMLKSIVEMQIDAENGEGEAPAEVYGNTYLEIFKIHSRGEASAGVSDIVDPNAYSIQDAKLKTEHDNLVKASEKERSSASTDPKIKEKFDGFVEQKNNEEEGSRLSRENLFSTKNTMIVYSSWGQKCEENEKSLNMIRQ